MDVRSADRPSPLARPSTGAGRLPAASEWVAATGAGALAVAALLPPAGVEDGPVVCPLRHLTGLPCPGCGLTRAWVYAAHGEWRESLLAHPFGLLSMALALALVVAVVRARWVRRPAPDLEAVVRRPWVRVVLGSWLLFAVVRLLVTSG